MTDKKEPTMIHGAKLYFETLKAPPPSRHLGFRAYQATAAYTVHTSNALMRMRVFFIAGYDPQKLLPAPDVEREIKESFAAWAREHKIIDPFFTTTDFSAGRYVADYLERESFHVHPLDGIDKFRREVHEIDLMNRAYRAPDLSLWEEYERLVSQRIADVCGVVYAGIPHPREHLAALNQVVNKYLYATFIHESAFAGQKPRGKITIYDYEDLEPIGSDFLYYTPRQHGKADRLFREKPPPREYDKPSTRRDQSYLAHDPTKRHKRRKKR